MASYHADLLDHLHTPPPPGYSAVSVQQIFLAAFLFLSERMTSMKRNAANQLPMDLALPTILSQPTVAFHLLPLSGATQSSVSEKQGIKPKEMVEKPSQAANRQRKGRTKGSKGKNRGPSMPAGLINKALETPKNSAFARRLTCPMVAPRPKQEKAAPRAFICAQSQCVSNPIRFKTIDEARKVSPKAGHYKDSRSAKFLH